MGAGWSGFIGVQSNNPFTQNFIFVENFDKFDNLETLFLLFNKSILLPVNAVCKIAG